MFRLAVAVWLITADAASATIGTASYYGGGERLNRHTASGAVFNPNAMAAAHWTLPLGTRVRVTNLRNNKSVVVRINDRGPHPRLHRAIDLTRAAFAKIASTGSGLIRVAISVIR